MSLIVLPVALPLLAAFLLQPLERVVPWLARVLGPLTLVACIAVLGRVALDAGEAPFAVAIGNFAPPLGITFYVDALALVFALAVPVFGLLFWPRRAEGERVRIEALMLLLVAASTGLALSGDLFNLYVFYELAAIASLGLVAASGTPRAWVATLRYLFIGALGSVLALVGVTIVYLRAGTLNLADLARLAPERLDDPLSLVAFVCLLIGFGVKAELFPVNTWVPEVYATAPARISAFLAGVVSKLAVLVVLRVLVLVFPQPEAAQILLVLGVLGLVSGEFAAWRARDFRRMLAFSSVGQLGLVFIGFAILGPAGVMAGLAVALHHLVVKPALFALAERWDGSLDGLGGAARSAPWAAGLFVLFALSLIGVPPLPGFWAKLLVLAGLAESGTALALLVLGATLLVTVLEANYLFRVATRLYGSAEPSASPAAPHGGANLVVATVLGALLLAATVLIDPLGRGVGWMAHQAADPNAYVTTVFPQAVTAKVAP